jgi:hypothetical protein
VGLLLGEQHENRGADVASGGTPARAELLAEATRTTEGGREVRGVEGWPSTPVAAPSALLEVFADVMVEPGGGVVPATGPFVVRVLLGVFPGHVGSLLSG